ncbi:MAG: RES family NAD+ phosphorylase [Lysobacterales bacterium]|jgi:hypothetical protein
MAVSCPPVPAALPLLKLESLSRNTVLFRVGLQPFPATAWDRRVTADYRFSALIDDSGCALPVTYCGYSAEVALLETVLRFGVEGAVVELSAVSGRFLAEVETTRDLQLIPLVGPSARVLGEGVAIGVTQCPASDYVQTRQWAHALRAVHPSADGIAWLSRQHGEHRALMLWGDKDEPGAPLRVRAQVPLTDSRALAQIQRLAERVGMIVVD